MSDEPRCPVCGYTAEDVAIQMDHHLCSGPGPAAHVAQSANPTQAAPNGEPEQTLMDEAIAFVRRTSQHLGDHHDEATIREVAAKVVREGGHD